MPWGLTLLCKLYSLYSFWFWLLPFLVIIVSSCSLVTHNVPEQIFSKSTSSCLYTPLVLPPSTLVLDCREVVSWDLFSRYCLFYFLWPCHEVKWLVKIWIINTLLCKQLGPPFCLLSALLGKETGSLGLRVFIGK